MYTYIAMPVMRSGMFAVESNHDLVEITGRLATYNETYCDNMHALVFACEGHLRYQHQYTTKQYVVSFKSFEDYIQHMMWEKTRSSIDAYSYAQHTKLRLLSGEVVMVRPRVSVPRVKVTLEDCQERMDKALAECERARNVVDAFCEMFNVYVDTKTILNDSLVQACLRFQERFERMQVKNLEFKRRRQSASTSRGE